MNAGRLAEARDLGRRLCEASPGDAVLWCTLAQIHGRLRQHGEAAACARQALALRPAFGDAHFQLAAALVETGNLDEARAQIEAALRIAPKDARVNLLAARVYWESGEPARAEQFCRSTIAADPGNADALFLLAGILRVADRRPDAIAAARAFCDRAARNAPGRFVLAQLLEETGNFAEAEAAYRQAIQLQGDYVAARNALAGLLERLDRTPEAEAVYRTALALRPNDVALLNNLGDTLRRLGRVSESEQMLRAGIVRNPGQFTLYNNLGVTLTEDSRFDEAEAVLHHALALQPDSADVLTNLVFCMNHNPRHSRRDIYLQHVTWAQRHAQALPRAPHRNVPDPDRRLRIGYVSPDFRNHPVAYFIEPAIRTHDRSRFEVYCYSETAQEDAVTARFRSYACTWRRTPGLPDAHVARMIEDDGIDILVDLAGHTHRNRLAVFRYAPAPVQVSYLGYCNTTGYPTIGWRIGDPIADPPGSQDFYTERLSIIEPCFFAYAPPPAAPAVAPLPALASGTITFGSLTNTLKLHPGIIELWSRVLHAVPNSRFLFARREIRDDLRLRLSRAFAAHGLGPDRIELSAKLPPRQSHLTLYHGIDIALDTFPWSGHTTSCEALHMGVPVVTLTGDRHASRMVASLLNGVGLPQLIAATPEQYISIARNLAADIPALAELRKGLRKRLATSPVCDAEGFTRRLEAAYREMWRVWCAAEGNRTN